MEIRHRVLDENHLSTLMSMAHHAILKGHQGKTEAIQQYRQILDTRVRVLAKSI